MFMKDRTIYTMCHNHSHSCPDCDAEVDNYAKPLECPNCDAVFDWIDCYEEEPWTESSLSECEPETTQQIPCRLCGTLITLPNSYTGGDADIEICNYCHEKMTE
jgi:hypothetical protein